MDPKDKSPATHSQLDKTCGNCRYGVPKWASAIAITCHRFPPNPERPDTLKDDWCGEFKAKKGAYDFNILEG